MIYSSNIGMFCRLSIYKMFLQGRGDFLWLSRCLKVAATGNILRDSRVFSPGTMSESKKQSYKTPGQQIDLLPQSKWRQFKIRTIIILKLVAIPT